ncbi:hypothetical protein FHW67_002719 [Herbaspirillum sp. Sphag1AN]|uniref:hypothetical protein n=1 Tax=unclassified Herbaspirillum TaxID=2624150 RepID=UPI001621E4D9|nr:MULTISPECIES: hypothetical protein [unclassified Herbaspirillum]MBB3213427.1 hypothetical protein [Herbaspirillum sp. Sphag1AN]MBB3246529.1 hypothetical protein [Herbaspirillum sp. Sphag64]
MANVKIKPQQAEEVKSVAKPNEFIVTDSTGREITLKKPSPLANLDFKKALGNNHQNVLYLVEVMPLAYVVKIGSDHVPIPSTESEIRALYQRLGEEGNEAVQLGVAEHFFPKQQGDESELKNS